jgi:hypothetical protein
VPFTDTVAGRCFVPTEFQLKATDRTIQGPNRGGGKRFFIWRPGLGPTQPHVQWVPAVNRPERDCDHSGLFRGELGKYYSLSFTPLTDMRAVAGIGEGVGVREGVVVWEGAGVRKGLGEGTGTWAGKGIGTGEGLAEGSGEGARAVASSLSLCTGCFTT